MKHWGTANYKPQHDLYYLENKLQFLDQETEWFYDRFTRRLHLKTRGNQHPCGLRVQARVQEYAFRMIDVLHLTLQEMTFFGTTVWAGSLGFNDDVNGLTYDSLQFKFPHAQKRMLGEHLHLSPTTLFTKDMSAYSRNAIVNCSFTGAEADPVLNVNSVGLFLENNEFVWNDWYFPGHTQSSATSCQYMQT